MVAWHCIHPKNQLNGKRYHMYVTEKNEHKKNIKRLYAKLYDEYKNHPIIAGYRDSKDRQKTLKNLVKTAYDQHKEKRLHSLSIGIDAFMSDPNYLTQYIENEGVYIDGFKYNLPYSWLTIIATRYPEHYQTMKKLYYKILDDLSKIDKEDEIRRLLHHGLLRERQEIMDSFYKHMDQLYDNH